jgi:hypothetical protein
LLEFGLARFASQGLELPEIRFEFHPGPTDCDGNTGFYVTETRTVAMCSLDKKTMLHELAHAWAEVNLTVEEKEAFTRSYGLEAWNVATDPWTERGTERAAEIIAWALLDRSATIRFMEHADDGSNRPVFRLLTIDDMTAENLYHGFVQLTGTEPVFRTEAEWNPELMEAAWQSKMGSVTSPEANRATG